MSFILWVDGMLDQGWEGQKVAAVCPELHVMLSPANSSLLLLPLRERRDNKNHLTGGWAAQA